MRSLAWWRVCVRMCVEKYGAVCVHSFPLWQEGWVSMPPRHTSCQSWWTFAQMRRPVLGLLASILWCSLSLFLTKVSYFYISYNILLLIYLLTVEISFLFGVKFRSLYSIAHLVFPIHFNTCIFSTYLYSNFHLIILIHNSKTIPFTHTPTTPPPLTCRDTCGYPGAISEEGV